MPQAISRFECISFLHFDDPVLLVSFEKQLPDLPDVASRLSLLNVAETGKLFIGRSLGKHSLHVQR